MANKFNQGQKPLSRVRLGKSEKIPVTIDNNPNLGYERKKWFYFLMIPILWLLTFWVAIKKKILGKNLKINTFWFDGISPICREIKENATKWRALAIIYNYEFEKGTIFSKKVTNFWLKILNAQAVRNRLKLVKQKLKEEIERISQTGSEISLLSIASGSAQGIIEVMAEFKQKGTPVRAVFLDLDFTALEHSKKLAQQAGVMNQIIFINKSASVLEEAVKGFRPHIVEVVGFLEYRPEEKAIELVKRIYNLLPPNGILLISNTNHNPESPFLYWVINWPMYYRPPKELAKVLIKGGFDFKDFKISYEPLRIHGIAICRKPI